MVLDTAPATPPAIKDVVVGDEWRYSATLVRHVSFSSISDSCKEGGTGGDSSSRVSDKSDSATASGTVIEGIGFYEGKITLFAAFML